MRRLLLILLCAAFLASCQESKKKAVGETEKEVTKESSVRKYISKYVKADADLSYEDSIFHSQQPKDIGDVNRDGKRDTVFIMSPFDRRELYFTYYFFDTTIPRFLTMTYCTGNTDDIFSVGDLDEDGGAEIGVLQLSCEGRSQWLKVYSLKNDEWEAMGASSYDMNFEDIMPKEQRIVKTGKGTFKMFSIEYDAMKDTLIKEWKQFKMYRYPIRK